MKISKRGFIASLAFALVASVSLPTVAQAETIDFSTWQAEEGGFGKFWKEAVEAFEKANPDIDINVVQVPYADYINQLTIRFASGRPPALVELPSEFMGIFASQDWFAPLDERIANTPIADHWSSVQSEMQWGGKTVGVLVMGGSYVLFYNDALLADKGIAPPASYDDFLADVGQLTDKDAGIYGLSAVTVQHPTVALDLMRTLAWSHAPLIVDNAYNLTSPEVIAALQEYRDLRIANSPLGNDSSMSRQLFIDGKTAFMVDGSWVYSSVSEASDEVRPHLKMMQAPFDPAVGGAVNSMHIAAAASPEQQDAAWAFINFISQEDWQKRWAELTVSPPAMVGAITPDVVSKQPMLEALTADANDIQSAWPNNEGIRSNLNEFRDILSKMGVRLLSSQDSTESIAADTQAELEQAFPLN